MKKRNRRHVLGLIVAMFAVASFAKAEEISMDKILSVIPSKKGLCAIVGLPKGGSDSIIDIIEKTNLTVYFQSGSEQDIIDLCKMAEQKKILGTRLFIDRNATERINLADNIADILFVSKNNQKISEDEALRIINPNGKVFIGEKSLTKERPIGIDDWTHPYHGPDNNPQSKDEIARFPYRTQYLADPLFGCIFNISVASKGKIFRTFGNVAIKKIHNKVLNKLFCCNAYNGTVLWSIPLKPGFMIHRNTMVATDNALYLADDESCKVISPVNGKILDEIKPSIELSEGTVWKWMGMENGILYALIGGEEKEGKVSKSENGNGFGHWSWLDFLDKSPGSFYKSKHKKRNEIKLKDIFGMGKNLFAIDIKTKKILWHYRAEKYLDTRGICMSNGKIYANSYNNFLLCLNTKNGEILWKQTKSDIVDKIGEDFGSIGWGTGFRSTAYIKANDKYLFIAGPQRKHLLVLSSETGELVWEKEKKGNCKLILREDALYAMWHKESAVIEYATGKVLKTFMGKRGCVRATGSIDSIFSKTYPGTLHYKVLEHKVENIAIMRPPCNDGVIVSNGLLHWGPWICGCPLSLYGCIGVAPASEYDLSANKKDIGILEESDKSSLLKQSLDKNVEYTVNSGIVQASKNNEIIWKYYIGSNSRYNPICNKNKVYIACEDGWIYTLNATTGKLIWRYHASPVKRNILAYGEIVSTWPVSGGIIIKDNILYGAAGIAHYDNTYVFALNVETGKVKWQNNISGSIGTDSDYKNGVSLQGELKIEEEMLKFHGGPDFANVGFSLKTGKCIWSKAKREFPSTFWPRNFKERIENCENVKE